MSEIANNPYPQTNDLVAATENRPNSRVLEFYRFSKSPIWQLQRNFFEDQGEKAWQESIVPHYVTSNPVMAATYVERLMAFWQDEISNGNIDLNKPVFVLELGAGSAVFSYGMLYQLNLRLAKSALKGLKLVYIISDIVQANLNFARNHEKLQHFINNGQVDIALVNAEEAQQLHLQISNKTIGQQQLTNPLAVIANYVFDGLTQDLVSVNYGELLEGYMALPEEEMQQQNFVKQPLYDWRELPEDHDYPQLLLEYYLKHLDDNPVLIPTGAINTLKWLTAFSSLPTLVLSADRGVCSLSQLRRQTRPGFANHGSFSLPVNYHALSVLINNQGDIAMNCQRRQNSLALSVMVLNSTQCNNSFSNTRAAFERHIEHFNPDDAYGIKRALEQTAHLLVPQEMLSFLRLSHWDYRILDLFYQPLIEQIQYLQPDECIQWTDALERIWAQYFPIGDRVGPCLHLGVLATELGIWSLGIECLSAALQLHQHLNIDEYTIEQIDFHMALCEFELGNIKK